MYLQEVKPSKNLINQYGQRV